MEDTFKVRVDRIFGSLNTSPASSTPPSSSLRSLWCLTDDEIERKEWNRDKGSPEPEFEPERPPNVLRIQEEPSQRIRELENDLDELEDEELEEDDAEQSSQSNKPEDYNDEEWEIKSSIGRDCTLDYEEEEDVYDKVAVGREKAGDRLYMKDFNDYGIDIDSGNELPSSLDGVNRDPRANHIAAKIRLEEDAEAAGKEGNSSSAANSWVQPTGDDANVKSILKRKDGQTDSKSQKRVRFDSTCTVKAPAKADDIEMETEEGVVTREVSVRSGDFSSAVPDYIRNPSRYTHYTFDTSNDMDEQSNRQAYMDFLNILKRSKNVEDEAPADLPKSVTFVPRKKRNEGATAGDDTDGNRDTEGFGGEVPGRKRGFPVGIAVVDDQESEACAMEEDDETESESAVNAGSGFKRAGRQYRVKAVSDVEE